MISKKMGSKLQLRKYNRQKNIVCSINAQRLLLPTRRAFFRLVAASDRSIATLLASATHPNAAQLRRSRPRPGKQKFALHFNDQWRRNSCWCVAANQPIYRPSV